MSCYTDLGIPATSALVLPNGEVIQAASKFSIDPTPPYASQATVNAFLLLNLMMRPPLTDDEIALMPNEEVIALYYKIKRVTGYGSYAADPLISNGLGGALGVEHETNLRQRIYMARPDLHSVTFQGKTYRVLLPPEQLTAPSKPSSLLSSIESTFFNVSTFGLGSLLSPNLRSQIVETATSIALNFVPVVGVFLSIAYSAGIQTIRQEEMSTILKGMKKSQAVIDEISSGADIAKVNLPNPTPDVGRMNRLHAACTTWQTNLPSMMQNAKQLNVQVVHFCDPAYVIYKADPTYLQNWAPWWNFFFSKAVHDMVFPNPALAYEPTGKLSPAVIGVGVGAILLYLLYVQKTDSRRR